MGVMAATHGHAVVAEMLLTANADPTREVELDFKALNFPNIDRGILDLLDAERVTPWRLAQTAGHTQVMKLLPSEDQFSSRWHMKDLPVDVVNAALPELVS